MSWTEVDLQNVSTDMERIPEGTYLFELLAGAKYSQWTPGKIEVAAKIAEGELKNRIQYFTYGDPDKSPAMVGAFKRLEIALARSTGVAIETGEDPVTYLNNPEVVGGKFIAPVRHREFVNKDGEAEVKTDIAVFKVKAVPTAA